MGLKEEIRAICERCEVSVLGRRADFDDIWVDEEDRPKLMDLALTDPRAAEDLAREILREYCCQQGFQNMAYIEGIDEDGDDDNPVCVTLVPLCNVFVIISWHVFNEPLDDAGRFRSWIGDIAVSVFAREDAARAAMAGFRAVNAAWRMAMQTQEDAA